MKTSRPPDDPGSSKAAYVLALRWIAARELSESQIRSRLSRRGFTGAAIDPAVERLLQERTIDDRRAAAAVARTEARIRRHGPRRVLSRLMAMHIDRDLATEIVREVFGEHDETDLLDRAVDKRLRGHSERLSDPRERRKVIAYLVRQGFSAAAASAAVRRKLVK